MSGYCEIAPGHPLHGPYHDTEYGFPLATTTRCSSVSRSRSTRRGCRG